VGVAEQALTSVAEVAVAGHQLTSVEVAGGR
jgi:hypothetical protein